MAIRLCFIFFFSSRRRHTRCSRDWSSDVCSSDLQGRYAEAEPLRRRLLESVEKTGPPKLIAERLLSYAALVRRMGRSAEAVEMETRALAIFPALPFAATAPPDI